MPCMNLLNLGQRSGHQDLTSLAFVRCCIWNPLTPPYCPAKQASTSCAYFAAARLFRTAQLCRQPTQSDGTGRGSASPALGTAIVGGCSSRRSSFWNTMTHGQRMCRAAQACSSRLSEAHSAQFPLCRRGLTDTGSAEQVPERSPVLR